MQKLFVYFSYRSLIRYMFCRCFLPAYRDIFLTGLFEKQKLIFLFFFNFWPHRVAYWILVLRPGLKPLPPAAEMQSMNHLMPRESPKV